METTSITECCEAPPETPRMFQTLNSDVIISPEACQSHVPPQTTSEFIWPTSSYILFSQNLKTGRSWNKFYNKSFTTILSRKTDSAVPTFMYYSCGNKLHFGQNTNVNVTSLMFSFGLRPQMKTGRLSQFNWTISFHFIRIYPLVKII